MAKGHGRGGVCRSKRASHRLKRRRSTKTLEQLLVTTSSLNGEFTRDGSVLYIRLGRMPPNLFFGAIVSRYGEKETPTLGRIQSFIDKTLEIFGAKSVVFLVTETKQKFRRVTSPRFLGITWDKLGKNPQRMLPTLHNVQWKISRSTH